MLRHDFQDSIPYFVFTAAHAIERAMNEALVGCGITFRQCQMLGMLAAHGSLTQAEVADRMGVEPSSVARLVDRMTRDGWIERRPDPEDRRKNRLVATEKAEPIWGSVREKGLAMRAKATRGFGDGEVAELKRLLRALRDNLAGEADYPDLPPEPAAGETGPAEPGSGRTTLAAPPAGSDSFLPAPDASAAPGVA